MTRVEFSELRRERPTKAYENGKKHLYANAYHMIPERIERDTLYLVVSDVYGLSYAFDVTKVVKKYTSGKVWTPRLLDSLRTSLETKELYLNDLGEVDNLNGIMKKVVAECGA